MKSVFFVCCFVGTILFGSEYNDLLLKTQATIFPKILLLDEKLNENLIKGKILYTIVYRKEDYQIALDVKNMIQSTYHGHIGIYKYDVNLLQCSDFIGEIKTTAVYVLSSCPNIKEIAQSTKKEGVISFAYDLNDLQKGLLFSLSIERTTVFYLNVNALNPKKVKFIDPFLQMVRFFDTNK